MFLYGFKGKRLTREQLERSAMVTCLDPEFARRLLGALQECHDAGYTEIGIGGTYRSTETQRLGFLRSHDVYIGAPEQLLRRLKTCRACDLDGVKYVLKPKTAHKAKPGGSCHERLTAPLPEYVYAADMVGAHRHIFATVYAPRWGLVHFGKVNGEEWHIQPADLPHSRSKFRPAMFPLKRWPREEDDMAALVIIEGDSAPWGVTGFQLSRLSPGAADTWRKLGVRQLPAMSRAALRLYPRPAGDLGPFAPTEFDSVA